MTGLRMLDEPAVTVSSHPLPDDLTGLTVIVGGAGRGKSTLLGHIANTRPDTVVFRHGTAPGSGQHGFHPQQHVLPLTLTPATLICVDDAVWALNPKTAPGDRSWMYVFKDLTSLGHQVVLTVHRFRDLDLHPGLGDRFDDFADRYLVLENKPSGTLRDAHRPDLLAHDPVASAWTVGEQYLEWQPRSRTAPFIVHPLNRGWNALTGT